MPPKLDPEIKVIYLRCTGGEIGATSALAPKFGPLGLFPKKFVDDITKETSNWITVKLTIQNNRQAQIEVGPSASVLIIKALKESPRNRKKQNKQTNKTLSPVEISLLRRLSTLPNKCSTNVSARELSGAIKETLGSVSLWAAMWMVATLPSS